MKRIVIIGATSSIAEHCARIWVKEAVDLTLIGRNQQKLDLIVNDLQVRSPRSKLTTKIANFEAPQAIWALVSELNNSVIDIALIAHGSFPDQKKCENDLRLCQEVLEINGVSAALFAEAFVNHMEEQNRGTLGIIGSVAGDRGRKKNYIYGAAKGLVTRYAQGLQQRTADTNVKVVLIKPGPTDTPMTSAMKASGEKMASPEAVAQTIVDGINRGKLTVYAPKKWAAIMMVVRHIPFAIMKKINI